MAEDRTTAELLAALGTETATLVRQELSLARAEMVAKIKPAQLSAAAFGIAGMLTVLAAGALVAAAIAALALVMAVWAAALIVGVVLGVAAAAAAGRGQAKLKAATPFAPEKTAQSVKEDIAWLKTRTPSGKK